MPLFVKFLYHMSTEQFSPTEPTGRAPHKSQAMPSSYTLVVLSATCLAAKGKWAHDVQIKSARRLVGAERPGNIYTGARFICYLPLAEWPSPSCTSDRQ
eukprot:4914819-Ditylum_brightwellii.AAC.1